MLFTSGTSGCGGKRETQTALISALTAEQCLKTRGLIFLLLQNTGNLTETLKIVFLGGMFFNYSP